MTEPSGLGFNTNLYGKAVVLKQSFLFSGAGAEKLLKFKKWFWSIVEKMTNADRQDLVS